MQNSNIDKVLNEFGERVTKLARINLGALKKDDSKKLRKSIDYNTTVHKNSFSFSIEMEDYGEWVDKGRKPGKGVPIDIIPKWIKSKPVRLRDMDGRFIPKTETAIKQAAFLINRKIKEEGIKPTNFLSEPFEKEFKDLPDELIEAYGLDIDDLLEMSLDKLNKNYK